MKRETRIDARTRLLLVLFAGVLMGALDIAIVGPALPAIQDYFQVDTRAIAWIFAIYVLFNLIGTPFMAKMSDRLGRRTIYVLDVGLFAAGSLLVSLAPSFGVALAGRAVQGLGAGGVFPVASAVIGDVFPAEKRGRALGMMGAAFGLAFLIGPIIGGILLIFGWRWLFVVNIPIAAAIIAAAIRLLPHERPAAPRPFDVPGMVVLAGMLAALGLGISQIDAANVASTPASLRAWPLLVLAVALAPVFWLVERRSADPVLRVGLFGSRQIRIAALVSAGAGLSEAGLVFVPALAVISFNVSNATSSFMLLPVVVVLAIASPVAGRLLDSYGSRVVVLGGTSLLALGLLVLGMAPAALVFLYIAGVLIACGLSALLGAPIRYIVLNEAPAAERASAQGVITLSGSIGQLVGGTLVGAVAASQGGDLGGYQAAYILLGMVSIVLVLLSFGLKPRAAELATVRRHEAARVS